MKGGQNTTPKKEQISKGVTITLTSSSPRPKKNHVIKVLLAFAGFPTWILRFVVHNRRSILKEKVSKIIEAGYLILIQMAFSWNGQNCIPGINDFESFLFKNQTWIIDKKSQDSSGE